MRKQTTLAGSIGQKIRQCRLARNLTQQELAGDQFSKSYISQLERGAVNPSLRALRLLAGRLGVSTAWLLEGSASAAPLLIKAATTAYFLGNLHEAERLWRQATAGADELTLRDRIDCALLEARLASSRGRWEEVIAACSRTETLLRETDFSPARHVVSQRYLWGRGWLHLGNQRRAILHWEAGLEALGLCGGPPSHEALLLMEEAAALYEALGDDQTSRSVRARARAAAAQIASNVDLCRWVLARCCDRQAPAATVAERPGADDLADAEAWARAHLLLTTAAELRQDAGGCREGTGEAEP